MKTRLTIICLALLVTTGAQANTIAWPPVFQGSVALPSQSHGSGYSPSANEFWVPQWAGETVYRYDRSYNFLGTFSAGQSQMMQLWGDTDGSYYTANWGYQTVTKKTSMSNSANLWSYDFGNIVSGVAADDSYVYAMGYSSSSVVKLDKTTGLWAGSINLNGMTGGLTYGGLAVVDHYLIRGGSAGLIEYFDLDNGNRLGSFSTGYTIYGSAFDGTTYYIHQNDSTTELFTIAIVPEPASAILLAMGLSGMLLRRKRR